MVGDSEAILGVDHALVVLYFCCTLCSVFPFTGRKPKPNIIFILADDFWGDVGFHGGEQKHHTLISLHRKALS